MGEDFNYEENVKEFSRNRKDVMIQNVDLANAECLFTQIINKAEKKICILTGTLDDSFYTKESIQNALKSFVDRTNGQGIIEIILEARDDSINKCKGITKFIFNKYLEYGKTGNLRQYQLMDNHLIINEKEEYIIHFINVDDDGPFRYEKHSLNGMNSASIDDSEISIIQAQANFGNPKFSSSLQELFDRLKYYKNNKTIDIQ